MRKWAPAPPSPHPYITEIVLIDMALFFNENLCMSERVGTFEIRPCSHARGDEIVITSSREGSLPSVSRSFPYLVAWSDGQVTRGNMNRIQAALTILGQTWPDDSTTERR